MARKPSTDEMLIMLPPAPPGDHDRREGTYTAKDVLEVDVVDRVPLLLAGIEEGLDQVEMVPDIVHQDVDALACVGELLCKGVVPLRCR